MSSSSMSPTPVSVDKRGPRIRRMFADIAPRYDFLNHLLSANQDRAWRRKAIDACELEPGAQVLDVCTGTGDLAFEAARRLDAVAGGRVEATDFCDEMVELARGKIERESSSDVEIRFQVADTQALPFPENSFDLVSVGFGIRNVEDLDTGIREMIRVARPGGQVLILEFTQPRWRWFRKLYGFYFSRVLPRIGNLVARGGGGSKTDAYTYLPESVGQFPGAADLAARLEGLGLEAVEYRLLTLGICSIHRGRKPLDPSSEDPADS